MLPTLLWFYFESYIESLPSAKGSHHVSSTLSVRYSRTVVTYPLKYCMVVCSTTVITTRNDQIQAKRGQNWYKMTKFTRTIILLHLWRCLFVVMTRHCGINWAPLKEVAYILSVRPSACIVLFVYFLHPAQRYFVVHVNRWRLCWGVNEYKSGTVESRESMEPMS